MENEKTVAMEQNKKHYPYKIGDEVMHSVDRAPFTVTGVRFNEVRILGDWSGGTNPYLGQGEDWVHIDEVKPVMLSNGTE
jgi:hypothetical protein